MKKNHENLDDDTRNSAVNAIMARLLKDLGT